MSQASFSQKCGELQERLFATGRFKYVAVEALFDDSFILHMMPQGRGAWEDGQTPDKIAASVIDGQHLSGNPHEVRAYSLQSNWPVAMGRTTFAKWPLLVAVQTKNSGINGVWGWDLRRGSIAEAVATRAVEPEEAAEIIAAFASNRITMAEIPGFYFQGEVHASSLDEALAQIPSSTSGQQHVLLYNGAEWESGVHNGPKTESPGRLLRPVSDYHAVRVSQEAMAGRKNLAHVQLHASLTGDYGELKEAVKLSRLGDPAFGYFGSHPAVQHLCQWWNSHAPLEMRSAGSFRLYVWDADKLTFIPCDPEEPPINAEEAAQRKGFAVFTAPDRPTVLAYFLRGREHDKVAEDGTGVTVFDTVGEEFWEMGCRRDEYDEAYYAVQGLRVLSATLAPVPVRRRMGS